MRNHRSQDVLARSYELVRLQMAGKLKPLPDTIQTTDLIRPGLVSVTGPGSTWVVQHLLDVAVASGRGVRNWSPFSDGPPRPLPTADVVVLNLRDPEPTTTGWIQLIGAIRYRADHYGTTYIVEIPKELSQTERAKVARYYGVPNIEATGDNTAVIKMRGPETIIRSRHYALSSGLWMHTPTRPMKWGSTPDDLSDIE